jgi:orotidine-5'-phosphate decarboxylase
MIREKDIYIAADFPSSLELDSFLRPFYKDDIFPSIKIGMELWCSEGKRVLDSLSPETPSVFLDLKLYDIPTTVGRTMKAISWLPVDLVTINALGGRNMMLEAQKNKGRVNVAGVTILTSMSEQQMWSMHIGQAGGMNIPRQSMIMDLSSQCRESGLDYVVCSVVDIPIVRRWYPQIKTICPGIRMDNDIDHEDQKWVATPDQAKKSGADYIVVGRSITKSSDPVSVYKKIWEEFMDGK